ESTTHRDNSLVHLERRRHAALVALEKNVVKASLLATHVNSGESTARSLAGEWGAMDGIPAQKCKQVSQHPLTLTLRFLARFSGMFMNIQISTLQFSIQCGRSFTGVHLIH